MLFFFDETFRNSLRHNGLSLGALCGVTIPEHELARVMDEKTLFDKSAGHAGPIQSTKNG